MRACWLKWVGRDWSISADYIWLNNSGANSEAHHGAPRPGHGEEVDRQDQAYVHGQRLPGVRHRRRAGNHVDPGQGPGRRAGLQPVPPGKERARERVRGARLVVRPYGNGQGRGQPATAAGRVQSPVRPRAQGGDGVHQVLRAARSTSGSASRRCKSTTPASASARSCLAAYFFSTRC